MVQHGIFFLVHFINKNLIFNGLGSNWLINRPCNNIGGNQGIAGSENKVNNIVVF